MENESLSSKTKVILFTSCKGGVGKSTVCANLAMSVALLGKRVLVIDCDFGNRCMDILLGLSDEALYDIGDVIFGRVTPERAVIADRRSKNLFFVPAPYSFDSRFTAFAFRRAVAEYRDSGRYDFIFIDTPGGVGEPLLLSASVADTAYIIVSPSRAAIRAAERTASFLYTKGVSRMRLIVNKLSGRSVKAGKRDVLEMVESASVRLIGAVPYDPEVIYAGNDGALTDELFSHNITNAFENIARRTLGESVPLFYHIRKLKEIK